ncbi:type II secretion system F family protein [Paenibacillus sp. HB172176]|uniref:type II secretion system F family protein n=1 Tax=Paenibacillus sp. HB172176 TaxID=2493690 RepID=UPI001439199B|nr:type II secretion system F family protein [Paenibacillus sp. HB172176]
MSVTVAAALSLFWLYLIGMQAMKRMGWALKIQLRNNKKASFTYRNLLLLHPFQRILDACGKWEAMQMVMTQYHMKLYILRGASWTVEQTKKEAATAIGYAYALLTACAYVAWISGELALLGLGFLCSLLFLLRGYAEASRKLEQRKGLMIAALPELISKLMLLVGAGETVQQAFLRCAEGDSGQHPLLREWKLAAAALRNGQSFALVLERFHRSCAIQETAVFTTAMLLNYRRGGDHFVLALRELSFTLWEKRKAVARISGEEASSKLVFPLVGILLIMMVIVAAPAFLSMK